MRMFTKLACAMVAFAMVLSAAPQVFAADGGSIKVTVKKQDGSAAAGVAVKVLPPMEKKPKAANLAKGKGGPAPIKEGTTGDDGTVTLTDIPAGSYTVGAGSKELGMGREKVTVEAGKTAEVTISLKPAAPKAK